MFKTAYAYHYCTCFILQLPRMLIATSSQAELLTFTFFPNHSACCLVCQWQGYCSYFQGKLQGEFAKRQYLPMSSFGQIEQDAH